MVQQVRPKPESDYCLVKFMRKTTVAEAVNDLADGTHIISSLIALRRPSNLDKGWEAHLLTCVPRRRCN
jgi:hypothetical protein